MEDPNLLTELPLAIWKRLFATIYSKQDRNSHSYSHSCKLALKPFLCCKIASKKLNQLLNDEYWFETLYKLQWGNYLKKYVLKRLQVIIKCKDLAQLENLCNAAQKRDYTLKRLNYLLPLAVQQADLQFLTKYVRFLPKTWESDQLFKSLICAYKQEDQAIVTLLLTIVTDSNVLFTLHIRSNIRKFVEAIKEGRVLNFDAVHTLIEITQFKFDESQLNEQFSKLFGERRTREQVVVIPEGELLNLERLSQKKAFARQLTNFEIITKKESNAHVTLVYREENGTKREIVITIRIDQSGDSQSVTYFYEEIQTRNINELILRTSLAERLFSSYSQHFVAVTKELLALPLEQQPWFRGILSEPARQALASDAPNHTSFFTYSFQNEVWISFTKTTSSRKVPNHIKLRDHNILAYLPKEKFVLGLHNGGDIAALAEHLVRKAVNEGDLAKVQTLMAKYNLDFTTNVYFDQPDNMILSYLNRTPQKLINNDMLLWLIENGAPFVDNNFCLLLACNEEVVRLAAEKGFLVDQHSVTSLMIKGSQYDTLIACWRNYIQNAGYIAPLFHNFFAALAAKTFSQYSYKNRTLIMLAWKHDYNCIIRQLPKEIVLEILNYEYIDEPPYWDVLDMVIQHPKTKNWPNIYAEHIKHFLPLVWKNWDLPNYKITKQHIMKRMYTLQNDDLKKESAQSYLIWANRFLERMPDPPSYSHYESSQLMRYCLYTESSTALSIVKLLLEKQVTKKSQLQTEDYSTKIPPIYYPLYTANKPMIEFLIAQDIFLTERQAANGVYSLQHFMLKHPETRHLLKFIDECRAKKEKKK